MTASVSSKQIKAFLVDTLMPHFDREWFIYKSTSLLRTRGYCVQGISLYFLRNMGKLRTYYFVQLLTIPETNLHVALGDSLQEDIRKKGLFKRFRGGSKEFLFDWPSRLDHVDALLNLLTNQIWPPIESALTPAAVLNAVNEHKSGSNHDTVLWSQAMLAGMCGDLESAKKQLQALADNLSDWITASDDGSGLVTESDIEKLNELKMAQQAASNQGSFDKYCFLTARKTADNLMIPKNYLKLNRNP